MFKQILPKYILEGLSSVMERLNQMFCGVLVGKCIFVARPFSSAQPGDHPGSRDRSRRRQPYLPVPRQQRQPRPRRPVGRQREAGPSEKRFTYSFHSCQYDI